MSSSGTSSSGEEDGDAEWKAAIHSVSVAATHSVSVAATTAFSSSSSTSRTIPGSAALNSSHHHHHHHHHHRHQEVDNPNSQFLKHYQLKAQKVLNYILEKTIEVVRNTNLFPDEDSANNGGGIQLFKHAPCGIVFDHIDEVQRPNKKPRNSSCRRD